MRVAKLITFEQEPDGRDFCVNVLRRGAFHVVVDHSQRGQSLRNIACEFLCVCKVVHLLYFPFLN